MALHLKLSDRQVKTWFQNRRAKWRRSNNGQTSSSDGTNLEMSPRDSTPPLDLQVGGKSGGGPLDTSSDEESYDEGPDSPINVS